MRDCQNRNSLWMIFTESTPRFGQELICGRFLFFPSLRTFRFPALVCANKKHGVMHRVFFAWSSAQKRRRVFTALLFAMFGPPLYGNNSAVRKKRLQ